MWFTANVGQSRWMVMIRIGIDLTFMVVGGAIFAIFWVETTDMGPESTAKQIQNSRMQIPGFRQNVGVIEEGHGAPHPAGDRHRRCAGRPAGRLGPTCSAPSAV